MGSSVWRCDHCHFAASRNGNSGRRNEINNSDNLQPDQGYKCLGVGAVQDQVVVPVPLRNLLTLPAHDISAASGLVGEW
jgi:hypothetical protein